MYVRSVNALDFLFPLCSHNHHTSRATESILLAIPGMRFFRLSARGDGISCDVDGAFIGPVPLLKRARLNDGAQTWKVRRQEQLSKELTSLYGLPIDVASKIGGFATIARALNRGN